MQDFTELVFPTNLDTADKIAAFIKEQIDFDMNDCGVALSAWLAEKANELIDDSIENIVPFDDYSRLLDKPADMIRFLKEDAAKPEHWTLSYIDKVKDNPFVLHFVFKNKSVDDGEILSGHAYISPTGKVRHSFCQMSP
jgi:hypothetical protein